MRIDITSMFFNSKIEGQTATPAWGTSIGQNKSRDCRIDDYKQEVIDMVIGMTYKSISDIGNLDISKGSPDRDLIICSVFENVYINEKKIENAQYALLLVREHSKSHEGRLLISYAPYIKYNGIANQVCIDLMRQELGCEPEGCWFVYDISIKNQSELYFNAVVVNATAPMVYDNKVRSKNRSEEWKSLIPADRDNDSILTKTSNIALQQIFYGAPGTGKSYRIKEQLNSLNVPDENVFRTTFHPDSDYSTFVGAYKPIMKKQYRYDGKVKAKYYEDDDLAGAKRDDTIIDKVIQYDFIPQTFIKAYVRAYQTDEDVYLVIEEINRGNCAQIFGDLFQLLDRDENGVSEYTVKADEDLRVYLEDVLGKDNKGIKDGELSLPSNLYIFATMNTSDQSLFPIDSAFKRRWDWEYEPIKYKNVDWVVKVGNTEYSWVSFQKEVNNRIFDATNSEDKMLGDFFVKPHDGIISEKLLLNKVLFYLWNDVCKDGDGDIFRTDDNKEVKFSDLYGEKGANILLSMMKHLGVTPLTDNIEEEDEEEDDENNGNKDNTRYSINGNGRYAKRALSTELVKLYISQNPEMSATEVVNKWKSLGKFVSHFIETQAEFEARTDKPRVNSIPCNGENIYLSTNGWGGQGVMDNLISAIPQEWNLNVEKLLQ